MTTFIMGNSLCMLFMSNSLKGNSVLFNLKVSLLPKLKKWEHHSLSSFMNVMVFITSQA